MKVFIISHSCTWLSRDDETSGKSGTSFIRLVVPALIKISPGSGYNYLFLISNYVIYMIIQNNMKYQIIFNGLVTHHKSGEIA